MDNAELDLSEETEVPETTPEEGVPTRKPFWLMPFIGLFFLLFALFLMLSNEGRKAHSSALPSEAEERYHNLSNETHTGLRLARLDDFLAQHGHSAYSREAQVRRDALKVHEEKAWARLTDAFYRADADKAAKQAAIKAYVDIWTPLHRPEQLKTLEQVLPNDAVPNFKPGERRSRFASGGNAQFLEGGPVVSLPEPTSRAPSRRVERGQRSLPGDVEPRIRGSARKPSYPRNARRRGVEADVVLALDIDDSGRVRQIRVVSVDADRYEDDFIRAAKRAARKTRFYPKTVRGRAVAKSGHIQKYSFKNSR